MARLLAFGLAAFLFNSCDFFFPKDSDDPGDTPSEELTVSEVVDPEATTYDNLNSDAFWGAVALDSHLTPHVLYSLSNTKTYYAVREPSGGWIRQEVNGIGYTPQMVVDQAGHPHVAHHLGYSYYNGTSWRHERIGDYTFLIDTNMKRNQFNIVIGADETIHMVFFQDSGADGTYRVIYASTTIGGAIQHEVVAQKTFTNGSVGEYLSLDLDMDGNPILAYQDCERSSPTNNDDRGTIRVVRRIEGTWETVQNYETGSSNLNYGTHCLGCYTPDNVYHMVFTWASMGSSYNLDWHFGTHQLPSFVDSRVELPYIEPTHYIDGKMHLFCFDNGDVKIVTSYGGLNNTIHSRYYTHDRATGATASISLNMDDFLVHYSGPPGWEGVPPIEPYGPLTPVEDPDPEDPPTEPPVDPPVEPPEPELPFQIASVATYNADNTTSNSILGPVILSLYVDDGTIYAGTYNGLSVSTDGGSTWTNHSEDDGLPADEINSVHADGQTIYAGTAAGLAISEDAGTSWEAVQDSQVVGRILALSRNDLYLYAATGFGLARLQDGSSDWVLLTTTDGLPNDIVRSLYSQGSYLFAATDNGLAISSSNGSSWMLRDTQHGMNSEQVKAVYGYDNFVLAGTGNGLSTCLRTDETIFWEWDNQPDMPDSLFYSVGADASVAVAGTRYGFVVSTNHLTETPSWTTITTDNTATFPHDVAKSCFVDDGVIYVGTDGAGLAISNDVGASWQSIVPRDGIGGNAMMDLFVSENLIFTGSDSGGASLSQDDGATWRCFTTADGLPSNNVKSVYATDNALYIGTTDGLCISSDDGASWEAYNSGSDGFPPTSSINDVFATDSIILAATQSGIGLSNDSGTTWQTINASSGFPSAAHAVFDLYADDTVIIAAATTGIAVSTDGGATWSPRAETNGLSGTKVYKVFGWNSALYASSLEGLYTSADGGDTWTMHTSYGDTYIGTIYGVGICSSGIFVASGSNGIYVSNDGGTTWPRITEEDGIASDLTYSVACVEGTVYIGNAEGVSVARLSDADE